MAVLRATIDFTLSTWFSSKRNLEPGFLASVVDGDFWWKIERVSQGHKNYDDYSKGIDNSIRSCQLRRYSRVTLIIKMDSGNSV